MLQSNACVQSTIRGSVSWQGVGIHKATMNRVVIHPAPVNHGIQFRVIHDGDSVTIPATHQYLCESPLCTALHRQGVVLYTVEHLLAAVRALGITNLLIEVTGSEVPIGDGSARGWYHMLMNAVIQPQHVLQPQIQVLQTIAVGDDQHWCSLSPSDQFELEYDLEFDHAWIGHQRLSVTLTPEVFDQQLADARTFGFLKDLASLRSQHTALGAGLDNVLVFSDQGVVNPQGMRHPLEPVQHKIVDTIGDLMLAGAPILGKFQGHKSGHALNHQLVAELMHQPNAWRWC